jgi:hypothetical protein
MVEAAHKLCLLGYTDGQLAEYFEVQLRTVQQWKASKPEFREAIMTGREMASAQVAHALFKRATGFTEKQEKVAFDKEGFVVRAKYDVFYPPDTAAALAFLRQKDANWQEKKADTNVNVNVGLNADQMINLQNIYHDTLAALEAKAEEKAYKGPTLIATAKDITHE